MSTALMWLLDGIAPVPANECRVTDLALDHREVQPGGLFLALPGRTVHGLNFAAQAAARGASAVLWEPSADADAPQLPATVFAAAVPGLKGVVGRIADRAFPENGQLTRTPTMKLSLSVDHRVLDGAAAARFLDEIVGLLETPAQILV